MLYNIRWKTKVGSSKQPICISQKLYNQGYPIKVGSFHNYHKSCTTKVVQLKLPYLTTNTKLYN